MMPEFMAAFTTASIKSPLLDREDAVGAYILRHELRPVHRHTGNYAGK